VSLADLIFYPPLCLAVVLVWAATREETAKDVVKHAVVLGLKLTLGLVLIGVALQGLLYMLD
jgi:F0F1-type ATP synthase assembly protein I